METHPHLQRWAGGAHSYLEQTTGCPPVVVVNLNAQCVLNHALADNRKYWAGRSIEFTDAAVYADAVLGLESHVSGPTAKANVHQLGMHLFKEPLDRDHQQLLYGGIAVVMQFDNASPDDRRQFNRTKDHERGHAIQRFIGKGNIDSHAPMAELYSRSEALKFRSNISSGLYDPNHQASVVTEMAMYIATGGWNEFGLSADEATSWMTAYFAGVRKMHGDAALGRFHRVLRTRVAKAAFWSAM